MNARRSFPSVAVILIALVAVHAAPAVEPDPPVAPSPDVGPPPVPHQVQPATFAAPARSGGLPLTADPPATETGARRSPPRQPLPDWRLLAAIGAAFAVLAVVRGRGGRMRDRLPADVFDVLGEASLGSGQVVRIVRFGPKTLLVGGSASGPRTLAEIGDPQATECIVAACRGSHTGPRGAARTKPADRPRPAPPAGPAGEVG